MPYTTKEEKAQALQDLLRYVQGGGDISIQNYLRCHAWLNGTSFYSLGLEAGISAQAVEQSVKRELKKVQKFVLINYKR